LFIGIGFKANSYRSGDYIIIASVALGAIHWIWSIIDVFRSYDLNPASKTFWTTIVVLIPPLGGMFYYMMRRKNVSF
jgi:hypothetical protein